MENPEQKNPEDKYIQDDDDDDSPEDKNNIVLKLGDIVEFVAPTNADLHQKTCIIDYIDDHNIVVVDVETIKKTTLNLNADGVLTDESITSILLLDRSEEEGYARQNGLLPHVWLDIYIGGDTPTVITGEISNLEEDMVEVITFPDRHTIYIDFEYKGVPQTIPFTKFLIRAKPIAAPAGLESPEEYAEPATEESSATFETTPSGDTVISVPDDAVPDDDVRDVLHEMYLDANEIVFGDALEELVQLVELPESQRQYGIEQQSNDMMDELLSTIPNYKRTEIVMSNIHLLIERFKQLRKRFSRFDENQNVIGFTRNGVSYKPLVDRIKRLNTKLQWIIPVVTQKRKIYDVTINEDNERFADVISTELRPELKEQEAIYKQRSSYAHTYATMDKFSRPISADGTDVTFNQTVLCDLDAIVDNLGEFASSIFTSGYMDQRKFVIQRYNLGLTKKDSILLKSGKTIYMRNQLTPSDDIAVKSILLLPEPVMNFSKIDLPGTDIMTRANLNHNYFSTFRLLKKKTKIESRTVDDLDNEIIYAEDNDENPDTNGSFSTSIKEFKLDEQFANDPDKFQKFLNVVIPKTRVVFRLMRKYIRNKLSMVEIIKELEPFLVYGDDVVYNQFKEIRYYMKQQIVELYKTNAERSEKYRMISGIVSKSWAPHNLVENAFDSPEYATLYETGYKAVGSPISELVYKLLNKDNGSLLSDVITAHAMKTLVVPSNLTFEPAQIDDVVSVKPKDCVRRFLTKRYATLKDLQADNNNHDVFCDKELDDTPYAIADAYGKEKKAMTPDVFMEFMVETLVQKHNAPLDYAKELAITIIAGRRKVRDGEYAVLDDASSKIGYYHRVKDHWVHDKDVEEEAFIDTNTLFCNIQSDCFKNQSNKACEALPNAKKRMDDLTKMRMVKEFENRVDLSLEQLAQKVAVTLDVDHRRLVRKNMLESIQLNRFSNYAYELGKTSIASDGITSPHFALQGLILGQDDFAKKQADILKFVELYCREPMNQELKEDPYWLYCKDTNTKLLPQSIFRLANSFVIGGDYSTALDTICAAQGTMSDDGDSIVDKHSGYVLRKIDFVVEDGYVDGFKVVSHSVIEQDLDVRLAEMFAPKTKPIFENDANTAIYNIVDSICTNMGIPTESIQEFVMRTTLELMERNVLDAAKYEETAQQLFKKKNVRPIPFEIYKNRLAFWIVASCILVAIQTAVPSFRVKKTYPGCVRSFSGYPMDGGIEDTTGIKYIACVMKKMESSIVPWNSIERLDANAYATRIKETVERFLMSRTDILDKYVEKRTYIAEHPNEVVPEEHSIDKWRSFLPPVVKVSMGNVSSVTKDFEKDLFEMMTKAHRDQHEHIDIIKSKCLKHGIAVIEKINAVVKAKDPILKTASKDPFLENACCNESAISRPMDYFVNDDATIHQSLTTTVHLGKLLQVAKDLAKPSLLYHPDFTGTTHSVTTETITEEHIYAAFIRYCNLDNDLPIPYQYLTVCAEKPAGFPAKASIIDQTDFLKKNGKRYSAADLQSLMTLVRNQTRVELPKSAVFSQIDALFDLLERFDKDESIVIDALFREKLRAVLASYKPSVMVVEERDELTKFKNYLASANERMFYEIVKFFDQYGNLSNREFEKLQDFLLGLTTTNLRSGDALFTMTTFVRNSIYNMTRVLPEIILNGNVFDKIPKHWDLSDKHEQDLKSKMNSFWAGVREFHNDNVISQVLQKVTEEAVDIFTLVQNLPVYSPIEKGENLYYSLFDNESVNLLYMYLWYSTLYEYTVYANDVNLLRADVEEKKNGRRSGIRNSMNEAEQLNGTERNGTERNGTEQKETDDLQEVDIQMGDMEDLKLRVARVLYLFINMDMSNKTVVLSYDEIAKKIRKEKNIEKHKIIEYLGNMDKDERQVEDQFKRYKMGRWNVGLQKGLVHYDKKTYDRETELERVDVEQILATEEAEAVLEEDNEAMDISALGEDYQDGDYYNEDDDE
jgi:hypothetical protein